MVGHRVQEGLPIWFHEALAKWYEGRWTGERAMTLAPSREELLSERIEAGALVAVLENYQDEGGRIHIPTALQPYMGGVTHIGGQA